MRSRVSFGGVQAGAVEVGGDKVRALSDSLRQLLANSELRITLSRGGRLRYCKRPSRPIP